MTDKLRARARELAEGAAGPAINGRVEYLRLVNRIEAAILQFAREALREEPDEAMLRAAWNAATLGRSPAEDTAGWTAMAEARARGME